MLTALQCLRQWCIISRVPIPKITLHFRNQMELDRFRAAFVADREIDSILTSHTKQRRATREELLNPHTPMTFVYGGVEVEATT